MKWFYFGQNNSGGYYIRNEIVSDAVFIQASSAVEAIAKAEDLFEEHSEFCECCGERWSYCVDDSDGKDRPEIYGKPLPECGGHWMREARLHYHDGRIESVILGERAA